MILEELMYQSTYPVVLVRIFSSNVKLITFCTLLGPVFELITKCISGKEIASLPKLFPSVHDAVQWSSVILNLNRNSSSTVNVISSRM